MKPSVFLQDNSKVTFGLNSCLVYVTVRTVVGCGWRPCVWCVKWPNWWTTKRHTNVTETSWTGAALLLTNCYGTVSYIYIHMVFIWKGFILFWPNLFIPTYRSSRLPFLYFLFSSHVQASTTTMTAVGETFLIASCLTSVLDTGSWERLGWMTTRQVKHKLHL